MSAYKLGRLPGRRPTALKDLQVYARGVLPSPPGSVAVPKASYPIDCNDVEGDCTIAGEDHLSRAWNALYPAHAVALPTEAEIKAEYRKLTGGQDTGLVEADVLKTWQTEGLFGSKIAGYAPVNPRDTLAKHQAVAMYGGCYLGIECPRSAQEQFAEQEQTGKTVPWTYEKGSPVEGGHCIVALGYNREGQLECATWGGVVTVTDGFAAHFLDEAWAILPSQIVAAKGDTLGIDLAALEADLALV